MAARSTPEVSRLCTILGMGARSIDGGVTCRPRASQVPCRRRKNGVGVVVLDPVVQRYRGKVTRIYFRADAAFAMPEVYEFLEAERIKYAIGLPANQVLQGRIGYCSSVRSDDRPMKSGAAMPISAIRPEVGPSRAG